MYSKIIKHSITQITIMLLLFLGLVVCVFPECFPFFHEGANYAVQIMFGYLFLGLVFLLLRQSTLMLISFACCGLLCVYLKSFATTVPPHGVFKRERDKSKSVEQMELKIAHFNLAADELVGNVLSSIRKSEADLVSVQEIRPDWGGQMLDSLRQDYPFYHTLWDLRMLGMSIFSKYPLTVTDTFYHDELPSLVGQIRMEKSTDEIFFVTTNTYPAFSKSSLKKLQIHLNKLSEYLTLLKGVVVASGDFNAVPWSKEIQQFEITSHLKDSRRGFMASFKKGAFPIFDVPMDHIFYSNGLKCLKFETINSPGSPHIGILGVYELGMIKE